MAKDMTQGNIVRTLVAFSIPLILSGLLQQLYGWADALIVGNFVGENALAAIGATGTVSNMFTTVIAGFSVGVSILTAHAWGEGDHRTVNRVTSSFVLLIGLISLGLAALGIVFARSLLVALNTPAEIIEGSMDYLHIIYVGVPFMAVYNIYSAVLRGIGDSRLPFLAIAVSASTNVVLDILLVAVIPLGIKGAAYATILSQILMVVFLVAYSSRKYAILSFRLDKGAIDSGVLRRGLRLSIPTALQSGVHSIGGLLLQNVMNSFGAQTVAAVTSAYRIDSIALLPVINIGSGISTFVGQNMGAGDKERAAKGLKTGAILALCTSLAIIAIILPLSGTLMRLFGVSQETAVIGQELIFALSIFYPVFGLNQAMTGYLQGMDDVVFTGVASILSLVTRIALSYIFAPVVGRTIIAYAEVVSWVLFALVCFVRARVILKRNRLAA